MTTLTLTLLDSAVQVLVNWADVRMAEPVSHGSGTSVVFADGTNVLVNQTVAQIGAAVGAVTP